MARLKRVPSPNEYANAVIDLHTLYTDLEFHQRTVTVAHELPRQFLVGLGVIAVRAIPEAVDRDDRLKLYRSMIMGAAAGSVLAEVVHDQQNPLGDWDHFKPHNDGLPSQEFIRSMHQTIEDQKALFGNTTITWLHSRGEQAAEVKLIDEPFSVWYTIGAGQTLGLMHLRALGDNGHLKNL